VVLENLKIKFRRHNTKGEILVFLKETAVTPGVSSAGNIKECRAQREATSGDGVHFSDINGQAKIQ
jgi:hypothetical protein